MNKTFDFSQLKPPGYTGHIPYKNELIGVTMGEANKMSLQ
jgi:hypothetical protein